MLAQSTLILIFLAGISSPVTAHPAGGKYQGNIRPLRRDTITNSAAAPAASATSSSTLFPADGDLSKSDLAWLPTNSNQEQWAGVAPYFQAVKSYFPSDYSRGHVLDKRYNDDRLVGFVVYDNLHEPHSIVVEQPEIEIVKDWWTYGYLQALISPSIGPNGIYHFHDRTKKYFGGEVFRMLTGIDGVEQKISDIKKEDFPNTLKGYETKPMCAKVKDDAKGSIPAGQIIFIATGYIDNDQTKALVWYVAPGQTAGDHSQLIVINELYDMLELLITIDMDAAKKITLPESAKDSGGALLSQGAMASPVDMTAATSAGGAATSAAKSAAQSAATTAKTDPATTDTATTADKTDDKNTAGPTTTANTDTDAAATTNTATTDAATTDTAKGDETTTTSADQPTTTTADQPTTTTEPATTTQPTTTADQPTTSAAQPVSTSVVISVYHPVTTHTDVVIVKTTTTPPS